MVNIRDSVRQRLHDQPRSENTRWIVVLVVAALLIMAVPADAESAPAPSSDAAITSLVRQSLARDGRFRDARLNVSTRNGVVTLTGSVGNEDAQRAAETVVRNIAGVRAVIAGHAARQN